MVLAFAQLHAGSANAQTCEQGTPAHCHTEGMQAQTAQDVTAVLDPHTCNSSGMIHMGGANGGCCWIIKLDDATMGTTKLTSTVVPGELGASLFLSSAISLDLLGQGELWLPWEYCDSSSNECTKALHTELAWSALAGLTFHIH